jgi:hypothetical protein
MSGDKDERFYIQSIASSINGIIKSAYDVSQVRRRKKYGSAVCNRCFESYANINRHQALVIRQNGIYLCSGAQSLNLSQATGIPD